MRVKIFAAGCMLSCMCHTCVQSHRSVCSQELITIEFRVSLERNNFISCLCWKSEIALLHGGPTCARKNGDTAGPDSRSCWLVWLSWFSSVHSHGIREASYVIHTALKFTKRVFRMVPPTVFQNSFRIQACRSANRQKCTVFSFPSVDLSGKCYEKSPVIADTLIITLFHGAFLLQC